MNRIQLTDLVLTDGCFDPLHVGHIAYLEAAARLAKRLVVHIASDEAIRDKGRESFQTRPERARTVGMLKCVGDTFEHQTLADAIRGLRPNVLAKGRDWIGKLPDDVVAACREVGTVIVYTDTQERTSTERLAGRDFGDENDAKYQLHPLCVYWSRDGKRYWDNSTSEWRLP